MLLLLLTLLCWITFFLLYHDGSYSEVLDIYCDTPSRHVDRGMCRRKRYSGCALPLYRVQGIQRADPRPAMRPLSSWSPTYPLTPRYKYLRNAPWCACGACCVRPTVSKQTPFKYIYMCSWVKDLFIYFYKYILISSLRDSHKLSYFLCL